MKFTRALFFLIGVPGIMLLGTLHGGEQTHPLLGKHRSLRTETNPKKSSPARVQKVSLQQLLRNPQKYEGAEVEVVGFAKMPFEGAALYLDKAHAEADENESSSVALLGWAKEKVFEQDEFKSVNNHLVRIVARFHAADKNSEHGVGHMGLWREMLYQIKSMTPVAENAK